MPTNYPGALDAFTNPSAAGGDTLDDPPHDDQHADANDAIEAIETELGVNPRGSEASVRARLDAIESATTPAGCKAVLDTGTPQSISSASNTVVDLDGTDERDTDGYHDPTTNPSRITIPAGKAGWYRVVGWAKWAANSTGVRSASIYLNGSEAQGGSKIPAPASGVGFSAAEVELDLAAGDYVELNAFQNAGAAVDVQDAFLAVTLIDPS